MYFFFMQRLYLLNTCPCFWCRQERRALAISVVRSQLSRGRPCSEGWMSALWRRNVTPGLSGRKSWRDGSRERQETSWQWGKKNNKKKKPRRRRVRNRGREGKKMRLWKTPQNDVASLSAREAKSPPSLLSHPQNNGRIYHAFPMHREDFSNGEEMTWK